MRRRGQTFVGLRHLVVRHEIEAAIRAGPDAGEGLIGQGESKRQVDERLAAVAVVALSLVPGTMVPPIWPIT